MQTVAAADKLATEMAVCYSSHKTRHTHSHTTPLTHTGCGTLYTQSDDRSRYMSRTHMYALVACHTLTESALMVTMCDGIAGADIVVAGKLWRTLLTTRVFSCYI